MQPDSRKDNPYGKRPLDPLERYRLYLDESGDHVFRDVVQPAHRYLCLLGCWFKTAAYLEANHKRLAARNKGNMGSEWYGYVYKQNHTRFGSSKIVVPSIATGSCFAIDLDGEYYFVGSGGGGGGGYGILLEQGAIGQFYLLGLLSSSVLSYYLRAVSTTFRGGYLALNRHYIELHPIRTIDFDDPADVARHDRMVALVERMLALHKQLADAKTPQAKTVLQQQIGVTVRAIEARVYALYGLMEDEIAIVEAGLSGR